MSRLPSDPALALVALTVLCAACAPAPLLVGQPVVAPVGGTVSLAFVYDLTTEAPTTLTVLLTQDEEARKISFPTRQRHHRVPLLGLRADGWAEVAATVTDALGHSESVFPIAFETGGMPEGYPMPDVLRSEPAAMAAGLTLGSVRFGTTGWISAFDETGALVYAQATGDDTTAVTRTHTGDLIAVKGTSIQVWNVLGETLLRYDHAADGPNEHAVPYSNFHHEVVPLSDGSFFGLVYLPREVSRFPVNTTLPLVFRPGLIRDDTIVRIAPDGTVLEAISLWDRMDQEHVGFGSASTGSNAYKDWAHANAVHYIEEENDVIVSLRHQDTVMRIDVASGEVEWLFGSPIGFGESWQPLLLKAVGEPFVYPTHQHAVEWTPPILRLFDNGNNLRDTPYYDSGETVAYSRVLELRIDEEARTVAFERQYETATEGTHYRSAMGNADLLDNDNRLATYGIPGRIVEWQPDGAVAFELSLPGTRIDRAIRVPSLYAPDVTVSSSSSPE